MKFNMVIYVSLINSTEMECILLLLKGCLILCLCVLEFFNFEQIKMIFRGDLLRKNLYCKCQCL